MEEVFRYTPPTPTPASIVSQNSSAYTYANGGHLYKEGGNLKKDNKDINTQPTTPQIQLKENNINYKDWKDTRISYDRWAEMMNQKYPGLLNSEDYDYKKYFNDNYENALYQLIALRHFPDTYKLPNHITFSNESLYSRYPYTIGGDWKDDSFIPSSFNRQSYPNIYKENRGYTEDEIYSTPIYLKGGHLYKEGGEEDERTYAASQNYDAEKMAQLEKWADANPITAQKPWYADYQGKLPYRTLMEASKFKDIDRRKQYLEEQLYRRKTGKSQYMQDLNKVANTLNNAAIGSLVTAAAVPLAYAAGTTVLPVLAKPLSTAVGLISKMRPSMSKLAPYAALGDAAIDLNLTVDGIKNVFTDNGIKKTVRLAKEGDTWGAIKSGAGDILDLSGGYGLGKTIRGIHRRNLHAYNTIEPASYHPFGKRVGDFITHTLNDLPVDLSPRTSPIVANSWGKEWGIGPLATDARDDAWRLYLGLEPTHGIYKKRFGRVYDYDLSNILKNYDNEILRGKKGLHYVNDNEKKDGELIYDFITGSHGGLHKDKSGFVEYYEPDKLFGDFAYRMHDVWDAHPLSRKGDVFKIKLHKIVDSNQNARRKLAQNIREFMYDHNIWGSDGLIKYGFIDKSLNKYRNKPHSEFFHKGIDTDPLLKWLDKELTKFEIHNIVGGKPFTLETEIPIRKEYVPNQVLGNDALYFFDRSRVKK